MLSRLIQPARLLKLTVNKYKLQSSYTIETFIKECDLLTAIMAIPGEELVGQNARLAGGVYSDDYMNALNQFATVDDVFGEHKEAIAKGKHDPVARLVIGTLGKSEYENHLVALVMTAAKADEWRAVERGPEHMPGLDVVTQKHFGYVTKYGGKTFLLPSPVYVTYCKATLISFTPNPP